MPSNQRIVRRGFGPSKDIGGAQKVSEYVLEMIDVSKSFPGVQALKNVSFRLRPGTVHALMGENGAGKSTLMKCLIGLYQLNSAAYSSPARKCISQPRWKRQTRNFHDPSGVVPVKERSSPRTCISGRQPVRQACSLIIKAVPSRGERCEIWASISTHTKDGQPYRRQDADGGNRQSRFAGRFDYRYGRTHLVADQHRGSAAVRNDSKPPRKGRFHYLHLPQNGRNL